MATSSRADSKIVLFLSGLLLVLPAPAVAGEPLSKLDGILKRLVTGVSVSEDGALRKIPPGSPELLGGLPTFVPLPAGRSSIYVRARVIGGQGGGVDERIRALGVRTRGRVGETLSLEVPVAALKRLAALPEVRWIKAARSYEPLNEISTGAGHVNSDAANAVLGATGQGVIVAVVDTGIDWTRMDFRNPDGTTRLLGIWDQTLSDAGHPPPAGFDFGAFYGRAAIDDALEQGTSLASIDEHGHGTHVMGTAAGNGLQSGNGVPQGTFAGVAPEAELLVVRVFEGPQAAFCDDCDLTAAVQFIDEIAAALGRPWVGNMSLGGSLGAHDGTDADELAIASLIGPGRPGAQMAISAGNSGASSRTLHWSESMVEGLPVTNDVVLPDGSVEEGAENDYFWLDTWYAGKDRITVEIATPGGEKVSASHGEDSGIVCTASGAVQVDATNAPDAANGDNQVFVQVWDSESCDPVVEPQPGTWTVKIIPDLLVSPESRFDLWNAADTRDRSWLAMDESDLSMSLLHPGTARNVLTVASYVHKDQWVNFEDPPTTRGPCCGTTEVGSRSFFSSRGPTRDGRNKPDVSAPGEWVASTVASTDATPPTPRWRARDGEHVNLRGTSMSAPHVAGVLALLFDINPDLDGPRAAAAIVRSAGTDGFTGAVPNTLWGHGKLSAPGAVFEAASMVTDLSSGSTRFSGSDQALMDGYNVYRGTLAGLPSLDYGACLFSGLGSPDFSDAEVPPVGGGFFYLVSGVYLHPDTASPVEGIAGTDSEGRLRTVSLPCD